jgi:hypothetical protein
MLQISHTPLTACVAAVMGDGLAFEVSPLCPVSTPFGQVISMLHNPSHRQIAMSCNIPGRQPVGLRAAGEIRQCSQLEMGDEARDLFHRF